MGTSADLIYEEITREEMEAGTGFMPGLAETMQILEEEGGYTHNLTAKVDHFECCSGAHKIYPKNLIVEKIHRFENSSDPDDNSILYAISDPSQKIKGLYVEAYTINQDTLSVDLLNKLKNNGEWLH